MRLPSRDDDLATDSFSFLSDATRFFDLHDVVRGQRNLARGLAHIDFHLANFFGGRFGFF